VDWVMSRGTVLIDDSGFVGTKGHGQYLKRDLSQVLH
jgi:dihydropyrimidinase